MSGSIGQGEPSRRRWGRAAAHLLRRLKRAQRGAMLLETVLVILIFAGVGTAVLQGLSTTHSSGFTIQRHSTAENIARNQMEYMFSLPYQDPPSTYPAIAVPPGYGVTCEAQYYTAGDTNVEKVVVTVTFDSQQLLTLETLRTK